MKPYPAYDVECPRCLAPVGEHCISAEGRYTAYPHASRRDMVANAAKQRTDAAKKEGGVKSSLVFGWGQVEKTAQSWDPRAEIEEIQPRLWLVRVGAEVIGAIGKEPWTREAIAREAERHDLFADRAEHT